MSHFHRIASKIYVDEAVISLQVARNATLFPEYKSRLLALQPPKNTAFVWELVAQAALYLVRACSSTYFQLPCFDVVVRDVW